LTRMMLKAKLHRVKITDKSLHYEGSITIDEELMKLADIREYELVQIANINNGQRLETYVMRGAPGSGSIGLNGAAARLGEIGDLIIIMSYALFEDKEYTGPTIVRVDENNHPLDNENPRHSSRV